MSHYTLHPHGIYQIRLPMGSPPWMNSYLLPDGDGYYTLIDPGFNTPEIIAFWHEISKEIGFTYKHIRKILVTHHHPDHYGLAGWVQQQSGAPVYVSSIVKKLIEALWGEGRPLVPFFIETYRKNGLPEELTGQLDILWSDMQRVLPAAELSTLDEGETIQIGDVAFEVLCIPGHAAGHSAFYSKALQVIFVGDQVMPDSLPDTCYLSDEFDPDPIHSAIRSLDKLKPYAVQLAFPGHHQPFAHFGERLVRLRQLHDERQQKVVDQFSISEWKTAYDAYYGVFEPVPALIQKRFHFTETIARVRYARSQGLIEQVEQNGVLYYRKSVKKEGGSNG